MRWDRLFDDLGSQLDREHEAEERSLALEEERLRLSRLTLRDRLVAMSLGSGRPARAIRVQLRGGEILQVRPISFGADWMTAELVDSRQPGGCVLPVGSIAAILPEREQVESSLGRGTEPSPAISDRIPLPFVLRDLARRRAAVTVSTDDGRFHGTLDRVARDHVDLALHEEGLPRRAGNVQGYRILPMHAIRLVTHD
ncbi:hypothetical protein [Agromyces sp. LHK192]|uniref:hypothetical protein n=1 Tax=Agromyces sp. LHK192 TaxID=2498704 RepID=UPI000FDC6DF0|nr:hypothetical protein [Agromyces sp. LHK192]